MGSANTTPMEYKEIMKLTDTPIAEMRAEKEKKQTFNPGLYYRSQMIGHSKTGTFYTCTPMKYLTEFFNLEMYYPAR